MNDTESAPGPRTHETRAWRALRAGELADPRAGIRPGDTVGRYQVLELLGTGGMGQVFSALDPELERTVALKVIRPDGRAPSARNRTRLLREAQVLARLQHPNVVAIHDVGTHGDQVFIAMEHVAGPTLGAWLAAAPRPWPAVRDVFVAAGRGLAAAHALGIVHRDFKPANVVVGAERVVVLDFGLALARGDERPRRDDRSSSSGVMEVSLTLSEERVGTPLYMAPEQHQGQPVTAMADQFAFATSLWAALFGAPPFSGLTTGQVLEDMARGPAALPLLDGGVPPRVRAALTRALALRPRDRWPSLADLLAELERDPRARRRRFLGVVGLAAAAIAAPLAFAAGREAPAASCAAAPAAGPWDEAARAEVRAAFLATGEPFAGESFARVDAGLRGRLALWDRAREEACAATELRHEQSAALMDARMACLARARHQIGGLIDVLRAADARAVERAGGAAASVGEIEGCDDVAALSAVVAAPRAAAAAVADLEREAGRVEALTSVGRMKEAIEAGPALVARARALGHPPALARALLVAGAGGCDAGDPRAGSVALYEAARAAGAARDDLLAARIYTRLVYCVGSRNEDFAAGKALAEAAEAALARAGNPLLLRVRLYGTEYRLHRHAGDLVNAFGFAELELQSARMHFGDDAMETALGLGDLGDALQGLGAYRAALAAYGRALPILEQTRGADHPATAAYLTNLAGAELEVGDLDAAARDLERAIAIDEKTFGAAQAGSVAPALRNLSAVREQQGRLDEARALALRARAIDERIRRPEHPDLAEDMLLLAVVALDRGALDDAEALAARALAIRLAAYGPGPRSADVQLLGARIAGKRHDLKGARQLAEQALALHARALGPRHPTVAGDENVLAAILIDSGQARAAVPLLEDALSIHENARGDGAADVVTARTLLSEALLETGDRGRALGQAERAVAAASTRELRPDIDGRARAALARARGHLRRT